jgi:hypothetical protein
MSSHKVIIVALIVTILAMWGADLLFVVTPHVALSAR